MNSALVPLAFPSRQGLILPLLGVLVAVLYGFSIGNTLSWVAFSILGAWLLFRSLRASAPVA